MSPAPLAAQHPPRRVRGAPRGPPRRRAHARSRPCHRHRSASSPRLHRPPPVRARRHPRQDHHGPAGHNGRWCVSPSPLYIPATLSLTLPIHKPVPPPPHWLHLPTACHTPVDTLTREGCDAPTSHTSRAMTRGGGRERSKVGRGSPPRFRRTPPPIPLPPTSLPNLMALTQTRNRPQSAEETRLHGARWLPCSSFPHGPLRRAPLQPTP